MGGASGAPPLIDYQIYVEQFLKYIQEHAKNMLMHFKRYKMYKDTGNIEICKDSTIVKSGR